jgi:hypothetical protein
MSLDVKNLPFGLMRSISFVLAAIEYNPKQAG